MTYPYNTPKYSQIKANREHEIDSYAHCKCCGEDVGREDATAINEQLDKCEKNCMWCGEDFDWGGGDEPSTEGTSLVSEDDFNLSLDRLNHESKAVLENIRNEIVDTKGFDYLLRDLKPIPVKNKETKQWLTARKNAILRVFNIDVDKEKFEPGYADSHGKPRDRIVDGISYEQADKDQLVHSMLKCVKNKPWCSTSALVKESGQCRTTRVRPIHETPMARMIAAGLLDYTSVFSGLYKHGNHESLSKYFGQIPRFKRTFTLTKRGEDVLKKLESGKKRRVFL